MCHGAGGGGALGGGGGGGGVGVGGGWGVGGWGPTQGRGGGCVVNNPHGASPGLLVPDASRHKAEANTINMTNSIHSIINAFLASCMLLQSYS